MKESTMKRIHFKADGTPYINLTNMKERKRVSIDIEMLEMLVERGLKLRAIADLYNTTESAVGTAMLCIRDFRKNQELPAVEPVPAPKKEGKILNLFGKSEKPVNPFADCIVFLEDGRFNGLETAKKFQKVIFDMGIGEYFYWKFHYAAFKKLATCSPEELTELLQMADKEKAEKGSGPKKRLAL